MYTLEFDLPEFKKINSDAKELLASIFSEIIPENKSLKILPDHPLFSRTEEIDSFYILREGNIKNESNGRLLFLSDKGDLVGFEKLMVHAGSELKTDFPVIVDEYDKKTVIDELSGDPGKFEKWCRYLALQFNLISMMLTRLMRDSIPYVPTIRNYNPGDIMIKENTQADEVYSMLEGEADVFVKGVKVGEVHPDELFGAIAALTGIPRTASVIAGSHCTVIVSTSSGFKKMLASNPVAVEKLVEDMTRVMMATNAKIVELSKKIEARRDIEIT